MSGPPPKPAHLRQRRNKKSGAVTLPASLSAAVDGLIADREPGARVIPNPDARIWHPQTLKDWAHAWESPMASQWLETDADALGRLALLWDEFYKKPDANGLKEIRLQSALFGLSPLDRSRLQWEFARADEAETKTNRRAEITRKRTGTSDPRHLLTMVKK